MPILEVENQQIELDEDGHLTQFDAWTPEVAAALADLEGVGPLTPEHLEIIALIRDYYARHRTGPMVHFVSKESGKSFRDLHRLFRKQPGKRAAKLAGLPKASGCA